MKRVIASSLVGLTVLLLGFVAKLELNHSKPSSETSVSSKFAGAEPAIAYGNWASSALTIAEQSAEADLIVRGVVLNTSVRKLKQVLPTYAEDGVTVIGEFADIVPFTDSEMRIIEVYKGTADKQITVMQTGGNLPATDGDPGINFAVNGDPIFVKGSEHILFLKNISGDAVHAKDRKLYITVNPAGRYLIEGQKVINFSEFSESPQLPKTVDELVSQIKQALGQEK